MNSKSQSGTNFSHLAPGYDLMASAGKQWVEAVSRMFSDAAESGEQSGLPGTAALKAWQQWYEDIYSRKKLHTPDLQVMATAGVDQQKRLSELQAAWWKCSVKAMQAVAGGMRNGSDPAQIMKDCMEFSEEYVRSYTDFLAAQSETLSEYAKYAFPAPQGGTEKATPAKGKSA